MGNGESQRLYEKEKEAREKLQTRYDDIIRQQNEEKKYQEKQREFRWNASVKYQWTKEEEEQLRKEILEERTESLPKNMKINILVFGLTGHGKSTLLNGFRSALLGERHVSHYYMPGSVDGEGSCTKGFNVAKYGQYLSIIDMGGIYESKLFDDSNIENIMSGRVPFSTALTTHLEVINPKQIKLPKPGKNDVSCVIIVMKPGTELGSQVQKQFDIIGKLAREGILTRHLVLTHLDQTDPQFNDPANIPNLVDSGKVQEAVKCMEKTTGIPPSATSFVRNYVKEQDTNLHSNILLLRTLSKIIFDAKETIERNIVKKEMEESDNVSIQDTGCFQNQ